MRVLKGRPAHRPGVGWTGLSRTGGSVHRVRLPAIHRLASSQAHRVTRMSAFGSNEVEVDRRAFLAAGGVALANAALSACMPRRIAAVVPPAPGPATGSGTVSG